MLKHFLTQKRRITQDSKSIAFTGAKQVEQKKKQKKKKKINQTS